jgi:hypothetical protein
VPSCGAIAADEPPRSVGTVQARVATRNDEPIARALAERLVALAARGPAAVTDSATVWMAPEMQQHGRTLRAEALAPNELAAAVRHGSELAAVLSIRYRSLAPCLDAARLRAAAPRLGRDSGQVNPRRFVPLIDTRLHALVRRDWLALTMTGDSAIAASAR